MEVSVLAKQTGQGDLALSLICYELLYHFLPNLDFFMHSFLVSYKTIREWKIFGLLSNNAYYTFSCYSGYNQPRTLTHKTPSS